jgi:dipeptidyl aminopeptidase/acylaminoacyl peptidase
LTKGKDNVFEGRISPKGNIIVFPQDTDGNENFHMYLLPLEGGEPQRITEIPYRMWGGYDWHPNGKEIARSVASMKSCGLETINTETGECFMLKDQTLPIGAVQYSHDGKWIACDIQASPKNQQILIINRNSPSDTIVYSTKEDSLDHDPSWSPNDKQLAYTSDANGARQVVIQDFQGEESVFLKLDEGEEAAQGARPIWSPRGDKIYYIVSKHSRMTAHGHPIDGKKESALPFPEGTIADLKLSQDSKIVAMHSSMTSPKGIYLYTIGAKSAVPLTPRNFGFDLTRLAKPQSVWYESFDGLRIHGWYLPAVSGNPPHPAVVCAHGGPWGQIFDAWTGDTEVMHCLSQSGFAVFAPNFRGSTGYGADFRKMDVGDVGGGDLEDVIFAAKWLRRHATVDSSKIAIYGHSYGGYMTLIALTKRPEVFAAGVSLSPVTDWLESYDLEDAAFRLMDEMLWGGSIPEKTELLKDRSPITHLSNIRAPVMIMAGKEDSRCPFQPVEKFVKRLREMDHSHEFTIEEKAGHISSLVDWRKKSSLVNSVISYLKRTLA